jgi:hypothetical protein
MTLLGYLLIVLAPIICYLQVQKRREAELDKRLLQCNNDPDRAIAEVDKAIAQIQQDTREFKHHIENHLMD